MKRFIFILTLVLGFALSVFAQNEQSPCPKIDMSSGGIVPPGEPVVFSVEVKDAMNPSALTYEWTVTAGKIIEGAGTPTIKVEIPDSSEVNLTATVEIKGLPENCSKTSSETFYRCIIRRPTLIDEFGKLFNGQVKAKMDEMYLKLSNEPNSQGYIINYGTDKEIAMREKQIQGAIAFRKFDPSRVTIVRGGANPNGAGVWTKIWTVPPGANNPQP